jgi:hypothetical protein
MRMNRRTCGQPHRRGFQRSLGSCGNWEGPELTGPDGFSAKERIRVIHLIVAKFVPRSRALRQARRVVHECIEIVSKDFALQRGKKTIFVFLRGSLLGE